jgi:hypothetical protein
VLWYKFFFSCQEPGVVGLLFRGEEDGFFFLGSIGCFLWGFSFFLLSKLGISWEFLCWGFWGFLVQEFGAVVVAYSLVS